VTQLATSNATLPDWSPDGTKLAFACNSEICVINADGSGVTQLTTNAVATHPSWCGLRSLEVNGTRNHEPQDEP